MELMAELDRRVIAEPRLERYAPPRAGVYLWRPRGIDPAEVRQKLRGAYVSLVRHRDEWWLRSVAANPMADPALVVSAVLEAVTA